MDTTERTSEGKVDSNEARYDFTDAIKAAMFGYAAKV
jgi:hypothetical protein